MLTPFACVSTPKGEVAGP